MATSRTPETSVSLLNIAEGFHRAFLQAIATLVNSIEWALIGAWESMQITVADRLEGLLP
jgi:hypothetical protein